jgi:uncharacterized coiled-coil protein SlyX
VEIWSNGMPQQVAAAILPNLPYEESGDGVHHMYVVPERRFDDRLRELCAKILAAKERDELSQTLAEMQWVIHQRTVRLRKLAARAFGSQDSSEKRSKAG